jgi:hypothetical protein
MVFEMPTVRQLKDWVDHQIREGKESLHTNHVVIVEEENEKKAKNEPDSEGKRKTRIAWDASDPDSFAEFHKEKEKYMKAAGGNPVLGTDAITCALKLHGFEEVRRFIEALTSAKDYEKP